MSALNTVPEYADFDDYRYTQRVVVAVRWFILVTWLAAIHWRSTYGWELFLVDVIGAGMVAMNAWLYFRIRKDRPVSRTVAVSASVMDLVAITFGIGITNQFENTFFILYYPALVGLALVLSSRLWLILVTSATAIAYSLVSVLIGDGLDLDVANSRMLTARTMVMFASALAAYLILREERRRRRDAVLAVTEQGEENLRLQAVAQQAELKAAEQRFRIGRDIHDGIAQSLYGLTLNLESAADAARKGDSEAVVRKLDVLLPISKQALLETRHYMHDLRPMLTRGGDLCKAVENLTSEFSDISGLEVHLEIVGERRPIAEQNAAQASRIVQEALANVLRHARAKSVKTSIIFEDDAVTLEISDDGSGFDSESMRAGFGLENMRSRAEDIGGRVEIQSESMSGTRVTARIPVGDKPDATD